MSDKFITISPSLYIGIKNERGFDKTNFPLSFVTWYEKDDAAFKKRKHTVDQWSHYNNYDHKTNTTNNGTGVQCLIPNSPIEGFQIINSVSRYSTSNKWFNVNDPRGFSIQISAESLVDLLRNTTLLKGGRVQGKCVWGRVDGANVLVPVDSEDYRNFEKVSNSTSKNYNVGDVVIIQKKKYIFLGTKAAIDARIHYQLIGNKWSISYGYLDYSQRKNKKVIKILTNSEPTEKEIIDNIKFKRIENIKTINEVYFFLCEENNKYIPVLFEKKPKITGVLGKHNMPIPDINTYMNHESYYHILKPNWDFKTNFWGSSTSVGGYIIYDDVTKLNEFNVGLLTKMGYPEIIGVENISNIMKIQTPKNTWYTQAAAWNNQNLKEAFTVEVEHVDLT
jgi:hypothetical protein